MGYTLLETLREELEWAAAGSVRASAVADLRSIAVRLLNQFDTELSASGESVARHERCIGAAVSEWLQGRKLERLGHWFARETGALWPNLPAAEQEPLIRAAVALALAECWELATLPSDLVPPGMSHSCRAVLHQLASRGLAGVGRPALAETRSRASQDPGRYADEVGFRSRGAVTRAGAQFMRSRGRDAVRWLVACELATATGLEDDWRCSREVGAWLLRDRPTTCNPAGPNANPGFALETTLRWIDLGLLTGGGREDISGFALSELGRDILTELTADAPPPLLCLAQAVAVDATADALRCVDDLLGLAAIDAVELAAAKYARQLGHDLDNKLVAVFSCLDLLLLRLPPECADIKRIAEQARRLMSQVVLFARVTRELAMLRRERGTPRTPGWDWFHLREALRAGANRSEDSASVVFGDRLDRWCVYGPRESIVNVITNLVGYAQGRSPTVTIRFGPHGEVCRLLVAGLGNPEDLSSAMSRDGYFSALRDVLSFAGCRVSIDAPEGQACVALDLPAHWCREIEAVSKAAPP